MTADTTVFTYDSAYVCVCRARDTYVKDRLACPVLRLGVVVFRPKVSRALRESSATRPERSTDRPPVNVRFPLNEDPNVVISVTVI